MKTLVAFYSLSGHTKKYAKTLAQTEGADLLELRPVKAVGKVVATLRIADTVKGKAWDIQPIGTDLRACDQLIICSPIWANNVPPYVNRLLELLPAGQSVRFKLISGSGKSGKCRERLAQAIAGKGCKLAGVEDIQEEKRRRN